MKLDNSKKLFRKANALIPGGVNSPVRAFHAVGGNPLFAARGCGSRLWDEDGNEFLDCVGSWGPLILGHAHPEVVEAVCRAARNGTSFGLATAAEVELAELICGALPSVEQVRLVNSGTEAVMSALRLARAFTGRDKIIKFAGAYHGHADGLLAKAGSGLATLGVPDSPGVPAEFAALTITLPYGNLAAVQETLSVGSKEIAAIIVEPVAGNMGVVVPPEDFLSGLRKLTQECGVLLIFDEVITGFRLCYGGAQTLFGLQPDLTCLGKIIGGGLPVGAYGGRKEIMKLLAPSGPVYQAGTLSGNPLATAGGLATLKLLSKPGLYDRLEEQGKTAATGILREAEKAGVSVKINRAGSMFTVFFAEAPVADWENARKCDTKSYAVFFCGLLEAGVYFPPSQFEAVFLSLAHSQDDLAMLARAAAQAFQKINELN
jgi:glutamate-1-semialdehyde 2,1-aminomutase